MNFAEWEPVYEEILTDFGFDRAEDERARDCLVNLSRSFNLDRFDVSEEVVIAGAGPSLEADCERLPNRIANNTVFAASTAADRLREQRIAVDCMVTDLDKNPDTVREFTRQGTPVAVHAHGDNESLIREVVPALDNENVLGTTQAAPVDCVRNFGGFTDGDRAAFLADHCGAVSMKFVGWDFDDTAVSQMKRHKLMWAKRLLYWLERRRDERFSILDGRRDDIDTTALPVD